MKSYSQSRQDFFALLVNDGKPGFFLDIGCSVPTWQSNSRLLLEEGWKGLGVDIQDRASEWSSYGEKHKFVCGSALEVPWLNLLDAGTVPKFVNYASLDIDFYTSDALSHLMESGIEFQCATIEHDFYRFGDQIRKVERELMKSAGYIRVASDVGPKDFPYEDWYVHAKTPDVNGIFDRIEPWMEGIISS